MGCLGYRPRTRPRSYECGVTVSAQDDVAEFAALLRKLKERTDRSYGSLARRLGMNTSTLHRYCAGEAVPVDFAPVERFAALCGASRAERVDLHHRWLRAVEARRRPRAAPGSAGADAVPVSGSGEQRTAPWERTNGGAPTAPEAERATPEEPAAGEGAPDDVAGGPPADGLGGRPAGHGAVDGPNTVGTPVRGATAGTPDRHVSAVDGPHAAATPARQTTRSPGSAGPPSGDGDVTSGPLDEGAGHRRPWYRRHKRVAVALAAVCALLATVGSLSALPDGRRPSAERGTTAASPSTSATTGPTAPRSRTPSSTPSASGSTTPEERSASPGPRRSTSSPAAAPAGSAPVVAPPLTWSADSQAWAYGCGHDYVVAKPPEQVPPPPVPQDAGVWATTQSAVHGGETLVELSVQGTSDTAVVLTALRVRVAGRAGPAPGNAYAMDQGCGGALTPRYFDVDLDKDRPIARAVAGNDAGTPIPAVRMPYRVSASDPEVLLVTARTAHCDCRWYLELDWSSQGRTGTVRIDDRGRPFRTSGIEGLPHYEYDTSARGWRPRAQ
ncbi:helix-turn-helix domain-containing protein [Streptomyces sp. NPDC059454]|uniref:transcriptional regulator n=1 Tax=Streptomyces sp. NPDC059454 TaxID=3346836 RepID=UPI0036830996